MHIQPLHARALLRIESARSDSSIVIPDTAHKPMPYGLILAVGPDCTAVAPGDKVIFDPAYAMGIHESTGDVFLVDSSSLMGKYVDEVLYETEKPELTIVA